MKKEDTEKIAAVIACELIGCDGDCDNCNKADVEKERQKLINEIKELARRANK